MPFEVQVKADGRWQTDRIFPEESPAVAHAQKALESNQHEAVRVVEERQGRGGFVHERVVFEEARLGVGQRNIKASPIEEAAYCETLEELIELPARRTIGRVLRQYLDHLHLAPLELIMSGGLLRQLERRDDLLSQAIGIVAALQVRQSGGRIVGRMDQIYELMRAWEAKLAATPELRTLETELRVEGLRGLMRAVGDREEAEQRFLTRGAAGLLLGDSAELSGKVSLMIELLERGADAEGIALVDDVLAELFDNLDTMRGILGRRADLAEAARIVIRLANGEHRKGPYDDPLLTRVNWAVKEFPLPLTRQALQDWLDRAIRSTQPLTKDGPDADRAAFTVLLTEMVADEGLTGGPKLSEAMTQRARSVLAESADDQRVDAAIDRMVRMITPPGAKLGYLLDLNTTPTGERAPEAVMRQMANVVREVPDLRKLAGGRRGKDAELAGERFRIRMAEAKLPDELKLTLAKRLEKLRPDGARPPPPLTGSFDPVKAAEAASKDTSLAQLEFPAGHLIFREGEPGDKAYILRSGRVAILCDVDGKEVQIAVVERGAIIGEMALIDDEPRMASARVVEDATMTAIPAQLFKRRLKRLEDTDPVMRRLLDVFVDRIRVMTKRHLTE